MNLTDDMRTTFVDEVFCLKPVVEVHFIKATEEKVPKKHKKIFCVARIFISNDCVHCANIQLKQIGQLMRCCLTTLLT